MRRIPQPPRSIDQALPLLHSSRCRVTPSPCRAALTSSPLLRSTTAAPFSTSQRYNGILDSKPDKKKHQAMVRRWQKRLLGEAEPIGAHVDPYDPTSPVRISPEEQGEEQEVLDEVATSESVEITKELPYRKAMSGEGLKRIGGRNWVKDQEELRLAQRFEKLLARPYPIATYSFGPRRQVTDYRTLSSLFHQAVVEVYTLKQAGMDMDLATYPHGGRYGKLPFDYSAVKLATSPTTNDVALIYPSPEAQAQLLERIQEAGKPVAEEQEMDGLTEGVEEPIVEEPQESVEETAAEADTNSVNADAPASKPAALVKQTEGSPFDFMSNRPDLRAKPAGAGLEGAVRTTAKGVKAAKPVQPSVPKLDLESAAEKSREAIAAIRQTVLETAAQKSEQEVAAMLKEFRGRITSLTSENVTVTEPVVKTKYRHIQVTDQTILFSLSKRLLALTGIRISDPQLSATHTLADLFSNLLATTKPKATKVVEKLKDPQNSIKLTRLPNVKFQPKSVGQIQKERQVGRWKVIQYALKERGLPIQKRDAPRREIL